MKRGILIVGCVLLVSMALVWCVAMWQVFGTVISPFPASCTVGVVGASANITVSGIGADLACRKIVERDRAQLYLMAEGTPQGDEICEGDFDNTEFPLHYLVRDMGLFKIIGNGLCSTLTSGAAPSTQDVPQATPTQ